jgi:hypothetical protein
MITFTKEEQTLLDRGWPRMIRLVDGHPHDKNPERAVLSWLETTHEDRYQSEWPREVAYRAVRLGPQFRAKHGTVAPTKIGKNELRDAAKSGPPSVDEMHALLVKRVATFSGGATHQRSCDDVWLAETILGADDTLDAIAEGFEAWKPAARLDMWKLAYKDGVASTIGFLLRRTKTAAMHVRRLGETLARVRALHAKNAQAFRMLVGYLDASLHGSAGVARFLGASRHSLIWAEYAYDDPDFVRTCIDECEKADPMFVPVVAIAGAGAMKDITKRKWYAADLPAVMRDFGMIRAPETVELALSLVGRTTAKDAPVKWIASHADYAMPIVEKLARKGNTKAKAVAKIISAKRTGEKRPSS